MADPDLQLRREPAFKGLTINVELCEHNSGNSKKMRYFRKNKVGTPPLDPPLDIGKIDKFDKKKSDWN